MFNNIFKALSVCFNIVLGISNYHCEKIKSIYILNSIIILNRWKTLLVHFSLLNNIWFSRSMFFGIYHVPYPRKMTTRLPKQVKSKHNRNIACWCWFLIAWYSPMSLNSSGEDPLLISSGRISVVCSAFGELLSVTSTSSPSRLQLPVSAFEHELAGDSLVFEFAFGVEHMVGSRQLFFKRQGEPGLLFSVLSDLPRNTCTGREWSYVAEIQIDDYVKSVGKWK